MNVTLKRIIIKKAKLQNLKMKTIYILCFVSLAKFNIKFWQTIDRWYKKLNNELSYWQIHISDIIYTNISFKY